VREVERARLLLQYHSGNNPYAIQRALNLSDGLSGSAIAK